MLQVMLRICISHVAYMHGSRCTNESVTSQIWGIAVCICTLDFDNINVSWRTCEWVLSQIWGITICGPAVRARWQRSRRYLGGCWWSHGPGLSLSLSLSLSLFLSLALLHSRSLALSRSSSPPLLMFSLFLSLPCVRALVFSLARSCSLAHPHLCDHSMRTSMFFGECVYMCVWHVYWVGRSYRVCLSVCLFERYGVATISRLLKL